MYVTLRGSTSNEAFWSTTSSAASVSSAAAFPSSATSDGASSNAAVAASNAAVTAPNGAATASTAAPLPKQVVLPRELSRVSPHARHPHCTKRVRAAQRRHVARRHNVTRRRGSSGPPCPLRLVARAARSDTPAGGPAAAARQRRPLVSPRGPVRDAQEEPAVATRSTVVCGEQEYMQRPSSTLVTCQARSQVTPTPRARAHAGRPHPQSGTRS